MPQLGETVTEGTVGRWLKKVGDAVAKYEPLLEVETDKVASEIPSPFAGVLATIFAAEGETVAVGAPVAEITVAGALSATAQAQTDGATLVTPSARPNSAPAEAVRQPGDSVKSGNGVRYSPAVRKLAREHRLDLAALQGSGRGGRLTARDVLAHAQRSAAPDVQPAPASLSAPVGRLPGLVHQPQAPGAAAPADGLAVAVPPAGPDDTIVRLTPIRKTIAERMVFSRSTIPFAWSMVEADLSELVKWRNREKDAFKAREGVNLTYVPVVIAAVCGAVREFPEVNSVWAGDHIIVRKHVNVGIAVDAPDGLVVPVARDADRYSLAGLAQTVNELADKARRRRLTMEDLSDGTITLNNTGALGSVSSVPIINPPQAAILTMEALVKRPWVVDDALAIRSIMNLCLCFDHRVFDGGTASRFLQSVKRRLENFSPAL